MPNTMKKSSATHRPFKTTALLCAMTLAVLGLAACGKSEESGKATATQVAAKVGSEEISVHQINQVLQRTNTSGASPEAVKGLGREVLEKLIDQQIAVDQATEAKLHRSPEVVTQIEAARREILARAYLQQLTSSLAKPTAEEAKKYYADNPQLFSQRRIFNVQEIVVPATPEVLAQLRGFATAGKPIEDVAAWLKGQNIKFNGGAATRAAEQIPLEVLPKVHALKDGQSAVLESAQNLTFLRVASSQSAPVPEAAALPRIEQFLANQRANEAITSNIKQLRASTKITYMGEFDAPVASAAAAPTTPAPAAPATPAPVADDKAKSVIEKGVAGLK